MRNTLRRLSGFIIIAITLFTAGGTARADTPLSIVDYMKSVGADSSFANRKQLFVQQWPGQDYKGSAEQNLRLLEYLLRAAKQVRIPLPSDDVEKCAAFYSSQEISKYLTKAFQANAIAACIVTGTAVPQGKIRKALQEEYSKATPADGVAFTAEEHKRIHDAAYKAAGCTESSANIVGWHIVNVQEWPADVIQKSIEWFGSCTVPEQK